MRSPADLGPRSISRSLPVDVVIHSPPLPNGGDRIGEIVVGQHHDRRLPATSVPETPIRDQNHRCYQVSVVLTLYALDRFWPMWNTIAHDQDRLHRRG